MRLPSSNREVENKGPAAEPAAHPIDRRQLLAGALVLAAGAALPRQARAGAHEGHAGHSASHSHPGALGAGSANAKRAAAANECVRTGRACLDHCFDQFRAGDTKMADCARVVEQMTHVCSAYEALAISNSPHLASLGEVCAQICEDCERECRKHEKHSSECKACADACSALIQQLRA